MGKKLKIEGYAATVAQMYERPKGYSRDNCYYCGMDQAGNDYAPPIDWLMSYGAEKATEEGLDLIYVPCCSECEKQLARCPYRDLGARRYWLRDKFYTKNKRMIDIRTWSDSELEELGDGLQGYVARAMTEREIVRLRYRQLNRELKSEFGRAL